MNWEDVGAPRANTFKSASLKIAVAQWECVRPNGAELKGEGDRWRAKGVKGVKGDGNGWKGWVFTFISMKWNGRLSPFYTCTNRDGAYEMWLRDNSFSGAAVLIGALLLLFCFSVCLYQMVWCLLNGLRIQISLTSFGWKGLLHKTVSLLKELLVGAYFLLFSSGY